MLKDLFTINVSFYERSNRSRPDDNQVHRPFFWPRNQTTVKGKDNFLQDLPTLMQEIDPNRAYRDALMKGIQTREGLRTTDWNTDETQYSYDTQFLKYLVSMVYNYLNDQFVLLILNT